MSTNARPESAVRAHSHVWNPTHYWLWATSRFCRPYTSTSVVSKSIVTVSYSAAARSGDSTSSNLGVDVPDPGLHRLPLPSVNLAPARPPLSRTARAPAPAAGRRRRRAGGPIRPENPPRPAAPRPSRQHRILIWPDRRIQQLDHVEPVDQLGHRHHPRERDQPRIRRADQHPPQPGNQSYSAHPSRAPIVISQPVSGRYSRNRVRGARRSNAPGLPDFFSVFVGLSLWLRSVTVGSVLEA